MTRGKLVEIPGSVHAKLMIFKHQQGCKNAGESITLLLKGFDKNKLVKKGFTFQEAKPPLL